VKKRKVLVIDDESDYCTIMQGYFTRKNYEVFIAYTLKEGLARINRVHPDILFLDNNLPDGQGWECVEEIVENNPHMEIYLVSAYRQKSDFRISSPNITIWEKPISLSRLNAVFEKD
jgi:DNA-binding NtrC family response regulator